jgi:hypothetical protein
VLVLFVLRHGLIIVDMIAMSLHAEVDVHETFDVLAKVLGHVRFERPHHVACKVLENDVQVLAV